MKLLCLAAVAALLVAGSLDCTALTTRAQGLRGRVQRDRRNIRPNIILIMTDDQDVELGESRGPCNSHRPLTLSGSL